MNIIKLGLEFRWHKTSKTSLAYFAGGSCWTIRSIYQTGRFAGIPQFYIPQLSVRDLMASIYLMGLLYTSSFDATGAFRLLRITGEQHNHLCFDPRGLHRTVRGRVLSRPTHLGSSYYQTWSSTMILTKVELYKPAYNISTQLGVIITSR